MALSLPARRPARQTINADIDDTLYPSLPILMIDCVYKAQDAPVALFLDFIFSFTFLFCELASIGSLSLHFLFLLPFMLSNHKVLRLSSFEGGSKVLFNWLLYQTPFPPCISNLGSDPEAKIIASTSWEPHPFWNRYPRVALLLFTAHLRLPPSSLLPFSLTGCVGYLPPCYPLRFLLAHIACTSSVRLIVGPPAHYSSTTPTVPCLLLLTQNRYYYFCLVLLCIS